MIKESPDDRYNRIVKTYKKRFGEVPQMLFNAGDALDLYLDLMEQAIEGKRGKISEADLGYPSGADV